MSNLLRAPSPATYADHRSPLRHGVQYESRQGQTHSPHSHSGHSYKGSAPEHYRSPSTHGDPRPSSSAIPSTGSTIYDRLPPQPAGRALPPLITPQSPRSGVTSSIEGSFDTSSLPQPRQTLPPLEPPSAYAPPASRYTYPTDNGAMPRYPAPNTDSSSYAYASPRPNPLPSQSSYPAEPTRSSYSFDPIRGAPSYQSPGQRLALPSMLSLGDPLAAAPIAQPPPLNGAPPAYTPDRYRFNAQPQTDHPARRRRGNLPKEATSRLNDWFAAHAAYPYPKEEEKQRLQEETGLSMSQVSCFLRTHIRLPQFLADTRRFRSVIGSSMHAVGASLFLAGRWILYHLHLLVGILTLRKLCHRCHHLSRPLDRDTTETMRAYHLHTLDAR